MKVVDEMISVNKIKSYRKLEFKLTALEEGALAQAIYDRVKRLDQLIKYELSDNIKSGFLDDRNFLMSMLHDLNEYYA